MRFPTPLLLAAALLAPVLLAGCIEGGFLQAADAPPADDVIEPANASPPPAREKASPEPEPADEPENPPENETSPPPASEPANETPSEPPAPEPKPPRVVTHTFTGNLTAHAAGLVHPADGNGSHAFPVAAGALRVVVTLTWNGTAPTDLDAVAASPAWCANATEPGEAAGRCHGSPVFGPYAEAPGWHQDADGDPSAPDAPSVVDLDATTVQAENVCSEAPCEWQARIYAKGPVANLPYTLRIDVHYPAA